MDKDGYPQKCELKKIREWDYKDFPGLMEYVKERWRYADGLSWQQNGEVYQLSTRGWSGNESIISALQENAMFWAVCWVSSYRGGCHIFRVKQ